MGLDGGGGGGGGGIVGVGNAFTGPATALEIIGDHCYAYSGLIQVATSLTECLNFTSGSSYAVVDLTLSGSAQHDGSTLAGAASVFEIYFNGGRILLVKVESTSEEMPAVEVIPLLIPPYTEVQVSFIVDNVTANMFNSVSMVGRIYR